MKQLCCISSLPGIKFLFPLGWTYWFVLISFSPKNIFTVTMTFLFILLILLGLTGLDWHFNVLPTVSETFSYENYDFFKSWKNAKIGAGGVQVRQSAAFVLKMFPFESSLTFLRFG